MSFRHDLQVFLGIQLPKDVMYMVTMLCVRVTLLTLCARMCVGGIPLRGATRSTPRLARYKIVVHAVSIRTHSSPHNVTEN